MRSCAFLASLALPSLVCIVTNHGNDGVGLPTRCWLGEGSWRLAAMHLGTMDRNRPSQQQHDMTALIHQHLSLVSCGAEGFSYRRRNQPTKARWCDCMPLLATQTLLKRCVAVVAVLARTGGRWREGESSATGDRWLVIMLL